MSVNQIHLVPSFSHGWPPDISTICQPWRKILSKTSAMWSLSDLGDLSDYDPPCQSIRCTNIYFWNIFRSKCNEPVWHNLCVWLISGWDFIQAFTVSWRNYMHGYKTNNLIVDYFNFIIIVVFFIFLINLYIPFSQNAVLNICLKSNEFFSVSTDSWHLKVFLPSPFNLSLLGQPPTQVSIKTTC